MTSISNNGSYSNPMSFKGGIKVKGIDLDPKKMEEVLKSYKKMTQHYADDLILEREIVYKDGFSGEVSHHCVDYKTDNVDDLASTIKVRTFKQWFHETEPKEIAKTFARIFKLGKFRESIGPQFDRIHSNLSRAKKSAAVNDIRSKTSKESVFQVLAESSKKRAAVLEQQAKELKEKEEFVSGKILNGVNAPDITYIW